MKRPISVAAFGLVLALSLGCAKESSVRQEDPLHAFAERYTAAWCSQDPARVAEFFSPDGSLTINDGEPAAGRAAITEVARGFMTAFPDMRVFLDDVIRQGELVEYHWTLTGTNTGPGGTGNRVRISGYEEWQPRADGLILESKGHFDEQEYHRQLEHGADDSIN